MKLKIKLAIVSFITLIVIFSNIVPSISASISLREFNTIPLNNFKEIVFSTENNSINIKESMYIKKVIQIMNSKTVQFSKKSGEVFPIDISVKFKTINDESYSFDMYKRIKDVKVHVFYRTKKSSIYLNGIDNELFLNDIFNKL